MRITKRAAAAVGVLAIASSALISVPSQAANPSLLIWVDAPRLPGAKEYAKIMKGKVDVKVELHGQGDLLAKVQLFNRVKKGWPDVVFGPPNDVAVLRNPIIGNAREISTLLKAKRSKTSANSMTGAKVQMESITA